MLHNKNYFLRRQFSFKNYDKTLVYKKILLSAIANFKNFISFPDNQIRRHIDYSVMHVLYNNSWFIATLNLNIFFFWTYYFPTTSIRLFSRYSLSSKNKLFLRVRILYHMIYHVYKYRSCVYHTHNVSVFFLVTWTKNKIFKKLLYFQKSRRFQFWKQQYFSYNVSLAKLLWAT